MKKTLVKDYGFIKKDANKFLRLKDKFFDKKGNWKEDQKMKKVFWSFGGNEIFKGYTDGTTWNSFANIFLNEEQFLIVLDFLGNHVYKGDWDEMLHDTFNYVLPSLDKHGKYKLNNGFCCSIIKGGK